MSTVTWLHLSDWHQGSADFDRKVVLDALLADIESRASAISPDLAEIDFVIFTGDLAFSGSAGEYSVALQEFVKPILQKCGIAKNGNEGFDRLFIVPGNHDVNRNFSAYLRSNLKFFSNRRHLNDTLTNPQLRRLVLSPMTPYEEFVKTQLRGAGSKSCTDYGFNATFPIRGHNIQIVGLNSAWLCGTTTDVDGEVNDYGNIIVGEPQLMHALDGVGGADLVIGALHHPFQWLALKDGIDDRVKVRNRLMEKCDVIVHGHEHEPAVLIQDTTFGDAVVIPAGSAYDRRDPGIAMYANSYNFCNVNLKSGTGRVFLRLFDGDRTWIADGRRQNSADGKVSFRIKRIEANRSLPLKSEPTMQSNSGSPPQHDASAPDTVLVVTRRKPSSPSQLSTKGLRAQKAGVATCIYLNAFDVGIRRLVNNRYVFAHAGTTISPYKDVFSLARGPRSFEKDEVQIPAWKLWLADSDGRSFWAKVDDTEDNFASGWHSFVVRWDHTRPLIEFLVDGQAVLSETNYLAFWPKQIGETMLVGAWPKHWAEHYVDTCIARWKVLDEDDAFDTSVLQKEFEACGKLESCSEAV